MRRWPLLHTITESFEDGSQPELLAELSNRSAADAAFEAYIQTTAEFKWLTQAHRGQVIRRVRGSGEWHRNFGK